MNDSAKVFQYTLDQLEMANTTEKVCLVTLTQQTKALKDLIKEETHNKSIHY